MRKEVKPSIPVGTIQAPPSKSMAHRLLIAAGLGKGTSVVHHIALSEDVKATIRCLEALGATCDYQAETGDVILTGADVMRAPSRVLDAGESGSTLRFFVPIALLSGFEAEFTGSAYLFSRPLSVYETICKEQGLPFTKEGNHLTVQGPLTAGDYVVDGSISSQFISGLLFALPLLQEDSRIILLPPVESVPYIHMTIQALATFGVQVTFDEAVRTITIPGGQQYASREVTVEGDYSNAAFLEALNLVGGTVDVTGLNPESLQGDAVYRQHFQALAKGTPTLDLSDCPDLAPILFALAAHLHGAVFTGTRRLRMKESDRAAVMQEELRKFGIELLVEENRVVVPDTALHAPTERLLGHQDHRIVMALATLAVVYGGTIDGAEAVRKSFPDYFDCIETLGIEVKEHAVDQQQ